MLLKRVKVKTKDKYSCDIVWGIYDVLKLEEFVKDVREKIKWAEENGYSNVKFDTETRYEFGDQDTIFYLSGDREEFQEEKQIREQQEKQREQYERAEFDRLKRKFNGGKE